MENETRSIEWITGGGHKIKVVMVTQYGFNQRSQRKTSGPLGISIDTTVDGRSLGGMARLESLDHQDFVAKIGKVGLSQSNVDQYQAALAELAAIIKPNNDACIAHEATLDAITASTRQIERNMAYGEDY